MAPKFKQYTFKDVAGTVSYVCAGGGRIYAGTTRGTLYMWKECLAMLNLRKWSMGRPDAHGYRARAPNRQSVTVMLEESQDEDEPAPDTESMRAFAKVADSDISENEFENDMSGDPILISLGESIPEHSRRSQRASTVSSVRPSNSSPIQSPAPSMQRNSSFSSVQRNSQAPASPLLPNESSMARNLSPLSTANPSRSSMQSQPASFEQQIVQLLQDSTADLATLPDVGTKTSQASTQSSFSGTSMNSFQNQQQMAPPAQIPPQTVIPQSQPAAANPAATEGDQRCVVCLDAKKDSILYQCGHVCVCNPCGKELIARKLNCPMCRSAIKDCIILYR